MSRLIGANDPCPCGSGRKYKKCCRDRKATQSPPTSTFILDHTPPLPALTNLPIQEDPIPHLESWLQKITQVVEQHTEEEPKISTFESSVISEITSSVKNQIFASLIVHHSHYPNQASQSLLPPPPPPKPPKSLTAWIPLDQSIPNRYIRHEEQKRVLPLPLQQFLVDINQLLDQKTPESVAEAWQRLQTIPRHEAIRFPWILNARHSAMLFMQQEQEFYDELMDILCTWQDEELWMAYGCFCLYWLEAHLHQPDICRNFLQKVETLSHNSSLIQLRLILGAGWRRLQERHEHVRSWLQESTQPNQWPWHTLSAQQRKQPPLLAQYATSWLPALVDGILGLLVLHQEHNPPSVLEETQLFFQFPWEYSPPEQRFALFDSICRAFAVLGHYHELQQFCQLERHRIFPRPLRMYWIGRSLEMQEQPQQALSFYEKAREKPRELHDMALGDIINFYAKRNELHLCFELFEAIQNKNTPDYLRARCCYELHVKHIETAFTLAEQYLALHPDDTEMLLQRLRMLEHLDHTEDFRREASNLLQSPSPKLQQTAHAILAIHYYCSEQYDEAQHHFNSLPLDLSLDIFGDDTYFAHNYFACRGAIQQQQGHSQQALLSFFRAKDILPLPSIFRQILLIACSQGDFDLVAQYLAEAEILDRDHFYTHFARICLLAHQKQWHECLQWLQQYTLEDFQTHGQSTAWIHLKLYTLAHTESTIAAFHFAEQHLDIILQHQEMADFRKTLWEKIYSSYTTMSRELGQQAQQIEQNQKAWQQQQGKDQKINKNLQKVLQHQEAELQRLRSLQYEKSHHTPIEEQAIASFRSQHPWIESLDVHEQTILEEAELFWLRASTQGVKDCSPVVLQLSRILESILNRWWIDPLVTWGLSRGATLLDFPTTTSQPLRPTQNRLSLGETARLLFHEIRVIEPDGSISVQKNSHSNSIHRDILLTFWQQLPPLSTQQRQYFAAPFITELQTVTRWRNRASHAGDPLPLEQAEKIRHIVLGSPSSPGMLASLVTCHPNISG